MRNKVMYIIRFFIFILMIIQSSMVLPAHAKGTGAKSWTFDTEHIGKAPSHFSFNRTGSGHPGRWMIRADKDAPSKTNVLAQIDMDETDYRFPLAIADFPPIRDGALSVQCKPISGRVDQACGLIFRYQDQNNYYVTRANALENNVNLYRVVNGDRQQFSGWDGRVASGVWHTLKVIMKGNNFEVFWDGQKVIDTHDQTFQRAGGIGIWTKADSLSYFDDLTIKPF